MVRTGDGRIHLDVPEMIEELRRLGSEPQAAAGAEFPEFPLVLIAGERRSYNANQIFRDPAWRRSDPEGALHVHPDDAQRFRLVNGSRAVCESTRGAIEVRVELNAALLQGVVTLPHGYGMDYPDGAGRRRVQGPLLNWLTDAGHRDPLTGTPYHKHVRVRVRPVASAG